ncbi:uncharacterized protein LOC116804999 [Drosophila grimshawi]|uniref:uncharacterized protein LOC116804999 n=1 Tax=Drosophila grimshawi TaxID=7222 RepID=UPI0013EF04AD|nr:uncharacterized protein LOC116804999 [Drosophila grimshawi]
MSPFLLLLSVWSILFISVTFGYSFQFGQLHPSAVPIAEVDIAWNCSLFNYMYAEASPIEDEMKFRVNQILVIDDSQLDSKVNATIIHGGFGFNYTILGLSCFQSDKTQPRNAKVTVLIYGLLIE